MIHFVLHKLLVLDPALHLAFHRPIRSCAGVEIVPYSMSVIGVPFGDTPTPSYTVLIVSGAY